MLHSLLILIVLSATILSCSHSPSGSRETVSHAPSLESTKLVPMPPATVTLKPAAKSKIRGQVEFVPTANGVRVVANVAGLKPNSRHGFHIHEFGNCSDPKLQSAGGHFNPTGEPHGAPESERSHVGDLGNLHADASGNAIYDRVIEDLGQAGEDLVGRSVIVHAGPDDLKTQPSGDSGGRMACGVIGIAKK